MDEQNMVQELTRHSERIENLSKRMNDLEKLTESVQSMAISLERVTNKLTATEERVNHIANDVDQIKEKPAKRWDLIITTVISGLVGAGIALLIK